MRDNKTSTTIVVTHTPEVMDENSSNFEATDIDLQGFESATLCAVVFLVVGVPDGSSTTTIASFPVNDESAPKPVIFTSLLILFSLT